MNQRFAPREDKKTDPEDIRRKCMERFESIPLEVRQDCIQIIHKVITTSKKKEITSKDIERNAPDIAAKNGLKAEHQINKISKGLRLLYQMLRDHGEDAFNQLATELASIQTKWRLRSGEEVIDRTKSHIREDIRHLLQEVFDNVDAKGQPHITVRHDFGRTIGKSICVETSSSDTIGFVRREKRSGLTRVVFKRKPEDSSAITVVLHWIGNQYSVTTAFCGEPPQPEPWDPQADKAKSRQFWATHALVYEAIKNKTVPDTLTYQVPSEFLSEES